MSIFLHRCTRWILPGLSIAALLLVTSGALPASAATATATCHTTPVFFGLHGIGEGPSATMSTVSPEIRSFDADQNAISGAVLNDPISYTTVYPDAWSIATTMIQAVGEGEKNLDAAITSYTKGCDVLQNRIALVGYSMGAWVINEWIVDHMYQPLGLAVIRAVVLFGDPCWANGNDQGLVRRWLGRNGCMPAADYPYPHPGGAGAVPFGIQSWTAANDPVSGAGWGGKKASDQLTAAKNCSDPTTCSHLDYTGSSAIHQGAQFVVSRLVG
jgi:predicted esterase